MERDEQQDEQPGQKAAEYEPPVVEDLDTAHGPAATPAGAGPQPSGGGIAKAAPREL